MANSRVGARTNPCGFDRPGTYFIALRGASQRPGDAKSPYGVIRNLDRVRVVVR